MVRLQPGHPAAVPPLAAGSGPYAGHGPTRRACQTCRALSARAAAVAGRGVRAGRPAVRALERRRSAARVPAHAADGRRPSVDDPWTREWELFRRHLVHLHYDELARWLVDAGIPRGAHLVVAGIHGAARGAQPFAVRLDSPTKNYDTGGMSVEGAKPRDGHLGAILYGAGRSQRHPDGRAAEPLRHAAHRRSALGGGRVQHRRPAPAGRLPGYADAATAAFAALWNYGAASSRRWRGTAATASSPGSPDSSPTPRGSTRRSRTRRRTSCSRAPDCRRGRALWTFGAPAHADADGWEADAGTLAPRPGHLVLAPRAAG